MRNKNCLFSKKEIPYPEKFGGKYTNDLCIHSYEGKSNKLKSQDAITFLKVG